MGGEKRLKSDYQAKAGSFRSLESPRALHCGPMDLDQMRHDYQKALRACHFAWTEREIAHRNHSSR